VVEALRYKPEGLGFDSRWVNWDFSLTSTFRPHCGPAVDLASNRNARNFERLKFLEPEGPVEACAGTAVYLICWNLVNVLKDRTKVNNFQSLTIV
jgi:hypothetical protein